MPAFPMLAPGAVVTLDIEKPAVGGRMIARHDGLVVLVSAAIPGERVRARVERLGRGVAYATTVDVLGGDSDRRPTQQDLACGGNVYAHIAYPRQLSLKDEIVRDALARIGRIRFNDTIAIAPSPETGYRMRARLHVRNGQLGFFREGTHNLCEPGQTGQFLPETTETLERLWSALRDTPLHRATALELTENVPATARVVHVELGAGRELVTEPPHVPQVEGVTGVSCSRSDRAGASLLIGQSYVVDELVVPSPRDGGGTTRVRLRRDVRSFFQGNRYLLGDLVRTVLSEVQTGPMVDLYAGVGLFAVSAAACGLDPVIAVEGDRTSGADLRINAEPCAERLRAWHMPVEAFLRDRLVPPDATFIVDPPRTGISGEAMQSILSRRPPRIVYVSCDVATLARDLRRFVAEGYELEIVRGFDLFPNTAHVETMAVLTSSRPKHL